MSKTSAIPNRTVTSLSINRELLLKAKEKGINMSLVLDAALERELNPSSQKAYIDAVNTKLKNIEAWMRKNQLEEDYYSDKYKGGEKNVWMDKKEEQRSIGQAITNIENS